MRALLRERWRLGPPSHERRSGRRGDLRPPEGSVAERVARWLRPGTLRLPALPPLSLYVHLPWCLKKCPYCDFNSHELRAATPCPPQRATSTR